MQRSKSFAVVLLLVVFLAGGALGYTADHLMRGRGHPRGDRGRPSIDRMAQELGLTQAQRAGFDSIMESRRQQMRELYKPIQPQLDSLMKVGRAIGDSTHEQLKRLLNPEQQTKLDRMRDEMRRRGDRRGSAPRGKPGP
jgi:Spy/CpxP family protein refolding chaperone